VNTNDFRVQAREHHLSSSCSFAGLSQLLKFALLSDDVVRDLQLRLRFEGLVYEDIRIT
jgi:hypothetical protein